MHYGLHSLSPRHLVVPRIPPGFIFQHLNITSNMVQHSQRRLFFQRPLFCKSESCISLRLQNEGGKLACELNLFLLIIIRSSFGQHEFASIPAPFLRSIIRLKSVICRFAGFVVLIGVSNSGSTRDARKVSKYCCVTCGH